MGKKPRTYADSFSGRVDITDVFDEKKMRKLREKNANKRGY